jgi:hypothetical protein
MRKVLLDFIAQCAEEQADPERVRELLVANPSASVEYGTAQNLLLNGLVPTYGGPVYRLPILTEKQCDWILTCAESYDFTPNYEEAKDYRIEEAILETVDPELYLDLKVNLLPVLNAWCLMINSRPITKVESLQIALYRPEGTPGTGWHHDVVSDFTCVISLNPDEFEGGGTGIRNSPDNWVQLEPLQKGWGLVFDGRSVQHRGMSVTDGERLLLVCWCSTEDTK